jgi:superfamily II DNA or RNA helicase
MLWSLARRELPWPPDLVIIDEAHLAKCASVAKLLARPTWAGARLLLASATPWRTDGRGFDDLAQHIVACPQVPELVAAGHLVPAVTYSRQDRIKLDGLHRRGGEYKRAEMAARFHRPKLWGDIVSAWQEHAAGLRTICFASSVEHSKALCRAYKAAGIPAGHLDGSTPGAERLRLLAALSAGDLLVLVNCGVLCEGFDLPALGCVQVARKTASRGLWLQMTGRALRPAPGKTRAVILDHGANWAEHGLVDDVRTYTLEGRVKRERPAVPAVKQCTACFRVYRSAAWLRDAAGWWQCPGCGHAEQPQRRRAPVTVKAARLERVNARKQSPAPIQRCPPGIDPALWARLELERIDRGHKPGWTWHRVQTWQRRQRSLRRSW